jgi:hypothetical protein
MPPRGLQSCLGVVGPISDAIATGTPRALPEHNRPLRPFLRCCLGPRELCAALAGPVDAVQSLRPSPDI